MIDNLLPRKNELLGRCQNLWWIGSCIVCWRGISGSSCTGWFWRLTEVGVGGGGALCTGISSLLIFCSLLILIPGCLGSNLRLGLHFESRIFSFADNQFYQYDDFP